LKLPPSQGEHENLDFVFRKFSDAGIAEEKSPERRSAKITGYIKE